jgi:hypothetical protein
VDTVTREGLQLPARKVPPKYQVDEEAVQLRGGVRTTTPLMPPSQGEEGYRPYRRGGGVAEEGFRAFLGGVGTTEAPRATLTVGAPIIPEGVQPARLIPSTGAWTPPVPGAAPSDYGYGAGRFTPSGGYGTASSGSSNRSGDASRSTATTSSSSAPGSGATASSTPSQTPSQAQAERSAASRAEVSATRAAGGKPNPNP